MTRTARRRWSREMEGVIDGISLGPVGPVLIHGYDPPAGGKWIDDVIPGRLGAYQRQSGEVLWVSPCEVGYGRGFGAGLGAEDDCYVLGPGSGGHFVARRSLTTGELYGAAPIGAFDQALVAPDVSLTLTPGRVSGILTPAMLEVWQFQREGERYHLLGRDGDRALVLYSDPRTGRHGVLKVDLDMGDFAGEVLPPELGPVHDMAVGDGALVALVGTPPGAGAERLYLLGASAEDGRVLWQERIPEGGLGSLPNASIRLDSDRLYVARDAMLDVRDALTGRLLGEMIVPGLDEHVAWRVCQGAGLLAEETRVSVFEIPD